jgi:hypothetical protein
MVRRSKLPVRLSALLIASIVAAFASARQALCAIAQRGGGAAQITLSANPSAPISPDLYGVNYVWHLIPATEFARFVAIMRNGVGATLMRYPGGWAAEAYDWDNNTYRVGPEGETAVPNLDASSLIGTPGIDPKSFLSAVPTASFVVPSAQAIRDPAQLTATAETSARLAARYGGRVGIWEIGNEWWLQRGAKNNAEVRAENLERYAALVAKTAPAMKAVAPKISLYVTGEWTHPEDFATLRRLVGQRAWSAVDGVSIHPYCGNLDPETLCSRLPQRAQAIRANAGKDLIYASEWSLGTKVTDNNYGIRNANQMVAAVRALAEARIQTAAYWPAVRSVPETALVSKTYDRVFATGMLFDWMSRYYRGVMIPTAGPLPSAAARYQGETTVFIATMGSTFTRVRIPLGGTGLNRVNDAQVMYADDPDDPNPSRMAKIRPLPTRIITSKNGATAVECDLSPSGPDRGSGWEILRITMR